MKPISLDQRKDSYEPVEFDDNGMTKWGWKCQHHENLFLFYWVDIGAFTYLNAKHGMWIKDYVQIGSHCSIYTESTIDGKKGPVIIGEGARIGSHSVIMPGVKIGTGAVVGAFSFVTEDVAPGTVVCGVPAKVVVK
jgi:acetyltransferase-like isoleucine patch superfamily enzyme